MCDHPIEQACECEKMAAEEVLREHAGLHGYQHRGNLLARVLKRLRSVRDWGSHALIDAQMEMREEQTRHRKAAVDRDDLHAELVKVRVALGEMEAERDRLAGENRRLTQTQDRVEEFARELERKGRECRVLARSAPSLTDQNRLTAKASTYEAEARSLKQILESR